MRIQASVGNTVNLRHEIKFENLVKNKNNFFIKKDISFAKTKNISFLFLKKYYFKNPKNLLASPFLPRQILKNIECLSKSFHISQLPRRISNGEKLQM